MKKKINKKIAENNSQKMAKKIIEKRAQKKNSLKEMAEN